LSISASIFPKMIVRDSPGREKALREVEIWISGA
jgi:hypothetical protein